MLRLGRLLDIYFSGTSGRGTKSLIVWSDYFEVRLGATKDCSGLSMTEAQQSISSKESNKPSKTSCPATRAKALYF